MLKGKKRVVIMHNKRNLNYDINENPVTSRSEFKTTLFSENLFRTKIIWS